MSAIELDPGQRRSGGRGGIMAKQKKNLPLATEIICMVKRRLIICRIALIISLAGNVIQAAVLIFR